MVHRPQKFLFLDTNWEVIASPLGAEWVDRLQNGEDVNVINAFGETALCIASRQGHVDCIRVLSECGADVNKAEANGCTPVYMSSQHGHADCIRVLSEFGA